MAVCTECGSPLEVGARQARRKRAGGLCRYCRARSEIEPRDVDFRHWADLFGVHVSRGKTARETLAAGLPDELREIVDEFTRKTPQIV